jgi:hypothetical protein
LGCVSANVTFSGFDSRELLGVCPELTDGHGMEKEIEHSVRIAKIVLSHVTTRCPEMFQMKDVPWYVATDDEVPR